LEPPLAPGSLVDQQTKRWKRSLISAQGCALATLGN
jgi:hypothetical protein